MSAKSLPSWLLIIGPIGMFVVWGILDPMLIGEASSDLAPTERALANLQLGLDNEVADTLLSIIGGLCFLSIFAGLLLFARSLQAGGATLASLASLIFPALIAIAIAGFGISIEASSLLSEGHSANAAALEVASSGLFGAVPMFWGLSTLLLGLAITREEGSAPAIIGWLLALAGIGMFSGMFIDIGNTPIGMVIWLGMSLVIVATGVVTLRKAN